MSYNPLSTLRRVADLHRGEDGTALTEFTICLPVWIVIMLGIANLGRLGLHTTMVQVTAQKRLWVNATHASMNDVPTQMSSSVGAATAAEHVMASRLPTSQNGTLNGAYTIVTIAMGVRGHWGESAAITTPLRLLGAPASKVITKDAIGDRKFPIRQMDDGLTMEAIRAFGSGGSGAAQITGLLADIAFAAMSATGSIHAIAAGIRYGTVKGEMTGHNITLSPGGSFTTGARYDVMVPPRPLQGASAKLIPFAVSRLIAETEKNYAVALNFGKSEWQGSSGNNPYANQTPSEDQANEQINESTREQCRQCQRAIDDRNEACGADPSACQPMPACASSMAANGC